MVLNFLDSTTSFKFAIHHVCPFVNLHKFLSTLENPAHLKSCDIGMCFSIFYRWLYTARCKYCRDKHLPPFELQVKMTLSCPYSAGWKAEWPWAPHPRHLSNAVKTTCVQTWSLVTPQLTYTALWSQIFTMWETRSVMCFKLHPQKGSSRWWEQNEWVLDKPDWVPRIGPAIRMPAAYWSHQVSKTNCNNFYGKPVWSILPVLVWETVSNNILTENFYA